VTSAAERQVEARKSAPRKGGHFPATAYADFRRPLSVGQDHSAKRHHVEINPLEGAKWLIARTWAASLLLEGSNELNSLESLEGQPLARYGPKGLFCVQAESGHSKGGRAPLPWDPH
jgi:hypothetical protein